MILTMENYLAYEGILDGNTENQKKYISGNRDKSYSLKVLFNDVLPFFTLNKNWGKD